MGEQGIVNTPRGRLTRGKCAVMEPVIGVMAMTSVRRA